MLARRICESICQWTLLLVVAGCCCAGANRLPPPPIAVPSDVTCAGRSWHDPEQTFDDKIARLEIASQRAALVGPTFKSASALGEGAYALAERLHEAGDDRAVDYWARAIAWTNEALMFRPHSRCRTGQAARCEACESPCCRAASLRHSAMIRILSTGQCYGRLDPSSHLLINGWVQTYRIPVIHQGFVWDSEDFDRLLVFEPPADAPGNVRGRGVPLVVLTPGESIDEPRRTLWSRFSANDQAPESPQDSGGPREHGRHWFVAPGTPFAATALIELPISMFTEGEANGLQDPEAIRGAQITLVNPLLTDPNDSTSPIAQSPAMPFSYFRQDSPYDPLRAFVNGDFGVDRARLRFFEPYQADKIPLLFVHGLLSDPTTFVEMADAMRADPVLRTRYQIWAFRYPTGEAFMKSAATLRRELAAAFARHPHCDDPLQTELGQRAVIVGHSMGGLVAKMQIVDSDDRLWRSVANVPLEQLRGPPERLAELRDEFFFEANPHIGRMVYIATPHRGSPWASRCIGRVGDLLATSRSPEEREYDALVAANPGAFTGEFAESLPSSVELLQPSSSLLQTLASIEASPTVLTHSIIGDHYWVPLRGRSDGVVPVSSAFIPEAQTTAIVDATHTSIQRSLDAQQELLRILNAHLLPPLLVPAVPVP